MERPGTCGEPPLHGETLRGRDDGGGTLLGRRDRLGGEGALQVHVEAQTSGQQLPLVLVQAPEGVQHGGAAAVHPGGEQAAGRVDVGRERLVVVELQLAREPAAISISITARWRTWSAAAEALRGTLTAPKVDFSRFSHIKLHFVTPARAPIQPPGEWGNYADESAQSASAIWQKCLNSEQGEVLLPAADFPP